MPAALERAGHLIARQVSGVHVVHQSPPRCRVGFTLAQAVPGHWTGAAADRGLLVPEPIQVRLRRPAPPLVQTTIR